MDAKTIFGSGCCLVEKTIEEINERIRDGSVNVVPADRMVEIVSELGAEGAAREVDVVTTGTFGAMCSSGAFLNLGHSNPPIKMQRLWLNDVEAYAGIAAVDAYLGATQTSDIRGMEYGGAHVIEGLVSGDVIDVRATSHGTDCYPRRNLNTRLTLDDLNQATMCNPRNAYQRYNVAVNSSDRIIYTYMGTLLPNYGNASYSGAGCLSPLCNDPNYETIGMGTRIFLCGAQGYIIGSGTQHDPKSGFGNLMVTGNLKEMSREFLRAAVFNKYGVTLYIGIGIPIPVLNERIAANTGVSDGEITTDVVDYSAPSRNRPVIRKVSYADLHSGTIDVGRKEVKTASMSSLFMARRIAETLKESIERGEFFLSRAVDHLSLYTEFKPMKQTEGIPLVKDIMLKDVNTLGEMSTIEDAARVIVEGDFTHLPITSDDGKTVVGMVTAYDVSKAVAHIGDTKYEILNDIMTRRLVTTTPDETIDVAARKMEKYNVSALPVVDGNGKILGLVRSDDISSHITRVKYEEY